MKPAVLLCLIRGVDVMAEALREQADVEIVTLYDPSSNHLRARGIEHRNLTDFVSDRLREKAFAEATERGRIISSALRSGEMAAEWPHFDPPSWSSLSAEVGTLLRRDFLEQIILTDMLRRCISEMDLRLAIVHEDICRDTRTAILAAHRVGVPALHILHGFPYGTTNAHNVVTADVIAAYSGRAKRIYEKFGAPSGRVVVTGNPFWDSYARPPKPAHREQTCRAMGLNPGHPIIHCAMTNTHRFSVAGVRHAMCHIEITELVLNAFASLSRKYPEWQFIVRPHPSDRGPVERLLSRAGEAGLNSIMLDKGYAYDSVVIADVLVCSHSNMGIEAILQGKPVVNVDIEELAGDLFREGMGPLFLEDDAVLWARSPEEIETQIEAAVVDDATKKRLLTLRPGSIERFNYANDGRAMERVCRLAVEMVKNNRAYVTPVARYPQFERLLAAAVPESAKSVLVLGRAASHVANALEELRPNASVMTAVDSDFVAQKADVVVLSEPLPHDGRAERILRNAQTWLTDEGVIIAPFRHGATEDALVSFIERRWAPAREGAEAASAVGEYCWAGVEVVLSRCELDIAAVVALEGLVPLTPREEKNASFLAGVYDATAGPNRGGYEIEGWVVVARRRAERLGEYGEARRQQRLLAERANRRGEARFAQGDVVGAANDFAAAVNHCNEVAVYFNNLATALHAAGESAQAWERLMEAIHLDPNHLATRENLRAVGASLGRGEEATRLLAVFGSDPSN